MYAGGGFFGHADDVLDRLGQVARLGGDEGLERALEFDFLGILRFGQFLPRLNARAPQREHGCIAAIVEDDVGGTVRIVLGRPVEDSANVVPIVRQALALDRKYGNVLRRNSRGGVILRRENVACRPAHVGAQCDQRLDQHGGLDRHVQRTGYARALQRLVGIFLAQRHQARHFGFGNGDFIAAVFGQRNVLDDVIGEFGHVMFLNLSVKAATRETVAAG